MTKIERCTSTKVSVMNQQGTAHFPCPKCAKVTIIRSKHARKIAAKYKCSNCNFEGP